MTNTFLSTRKEIEEFFTRLEKFLAIKGLQWNVVSDENNGDKFFVFENKDPYGYAVVKYSKEYLSLCSFREEPRKVKKD